MNLNFKPSLRERSLKAFPDLAILCALTERPMTGYEINHLFVKKFGIITSPSMIYSNLSSMERKNWIRCIRNRDGRAYILTDKGHEIVNRMENTTEEIVGFVRTMLKPHRKLEHTKLK